MLLTLSGTSSPSLGPALQAFRIISPICTEDEDSIFRASLRYEMRDVVRGRRYKVMQVRLISRDVLPTFLIRDISHMIGATLTELTSIYCAWCILQELRA